jgi:hypothetical protein
MALRYFGFQQESLPFDWVGASLPAITAALADDLQAMLLPSDLVPFLDIGPLTEQNRTVINKYGMVCTHVFKKQLTGREQATTVLDTAQRRATRLLTLLRGAEPVLFVRHQNEGCSAPTYEDWQAFITTIRQKFPTLRFHILYIQVGSKAPSVPPEVKLLIGDYPIIPIGGKFEDPEARCPELIKRVLANLCRKLAAKE